MVLNKGRTSLRSKIHIPNPLGWIRGRKGRKSMDIPPTSTSTTGYRHAGELQPPPAVVNWNCRKSLIQNISGDYVLDNPQTSSPLYATLPTELRQSIFRLALSAYYDRTSPQHYTGSHYHGRNRRFETVILGTCRRVYREIYQHILPDLLKSHVFWSYTGSIVTQWSERPVLHPLIYFDKMSDDQLGFIRRIQLFTDMYSKSDSFIFNHLAVNLTHLTIVIQLMDWENLASEGRIEETSACIRKIWGVGWDDTVHLNEFVLEIEGMQEDAAAIDSPAAELAAEARAFGIKSLEDSIATLSHHRWTCLSEWDWYAQYHHKGMLWLDAEADLEVDAPDRHKGLREWDSYYAVAIKWQSAIPSQSKMVAT